LMADLPADPEPFLTWAEGVPWLLARSWRVWIPRLLAATTLALVFLNAAHLAGPYWIFLILINLLYSTVFHKKPFAVFDRISSHEREYIGYAHLFQLLVRTPFNSPKLRRLKEELSADTSSAMREIRRLDALVGLADLRRNALIHFPLQLLTLWDFHILFFIERWQQRSGQAVRHWLRQLGELEAISALAGLAHDNPRWALPEISSSSEKRLVAEDLGHPLLDPASCVRNGVELGPQGTFLLVTGSNMSGKSTLLRAIGINVILAQAGGPVCARAMTLTPLSLGTSFRIEDSLAQGVSYFMAELLRLKQIVDQARSTGQDRTLLFLLDEILLGTNIVERQLAVRRVLLHLIECGAIGAISTHDLTLATVDDLAQRCRPVHFIESFQEQAVGPQMSFDYKLRQGISPTTNALKLLKLVGLED
jgi:hypothetical protein